MFYPSSVKLLTFTKASILIFRFDDRFYYVAIVAIIKWCWLHFDLGGIVTYSPVIIIWSSKLVFRREKFAFICSKRYLNSQKSSQLKKAEKVNPTTESNAVIVQSMFSKNVKVTFMELFTVENVRLFIRENI